ncbi:TonB-dependent receptor [Haliea sp. E17]|uniref:TonB-dependent receptor n=1 Tax=Haliea sp. E17 TaxID=3401576 RepID=UPI003AAE4D97
MKHRSIRTLAGTACLSAIPFSALVQAQAPASNLVIENIVVTAQRKAESIQETPVSISALSAEDVEKLQIDNVKDLSQVMPNVLFKPVTGGSAGIGPYIRGGGTTDGANITSEAEVGIYIDDVFQPRSAASFIEALNVERIEVLRGPQGTLYGRNSSAGALKIITARPAEEFTLRNEVGMGRWEEFYNKLSLSGPLTEDGALRAGFSGMYRDRDGGRQENVTRNEEVGAEEYKGFQADLYYEGERYTARLKGYYSDFDSDGLWASALDPFQMDRPYDDIPFTSGAIDKLLSPYESYTSDTQYGASLHLDFDLGETTSLSSVTSWGELDDDWAVGFSGGVANEALGIPYPGYLELFQRESVSEQDSVTQELQLQGELFDSFVSYVAGLYYFRETGTQEVTSEIFFTPAYTVFDITTDSYAAFGQASMHFSDDLTVTLGGRYTEDEKSIDAIVGGGTVDRSDSWNEFTPKAAVEYRISDDMMVFASYTEGFKAGGYNGLADNPVALGSPFEPQTVEAYEVGLKSEWWDNRLRINLAGFYNEYASLQQQAVTNEGVFITENYDAEHQGIEAEISLLLTPSISLWANGVYQDSEYTDTAASGGVSTGSLVGNRMTNVFDYQFTVGVDYSQDIGPGTLALGANVNTRDDFFSTSDNAPIGHIEPLTMVDAYASYSWDRWKLALSGKNLTDEKYWFTGFGFSVVQPRFMADPMTWRLGLSYQF